MALQFGPYLLDAAQRRLFKDGQDVRLAPKAFDLLALLIAERPRALPKDELLSRVWSGVFVSDSTLTTAIRDLRRALDDDAAAPRYIRTAYAFGYAFAGDVREPGGATETASPWRLILLERELHLAVGPNVLGREGPGVLVIDAPTISRRHARLTVTASGVTCEDLGSKNGTYVGPTRIRTSVTVSDGDEIRFGAVLAVLRWREIKETETIAAAE